MSFAPRGSSLAPSPVPGSFSNSTIRSNIGARAGSGQDINLSLRELRDLERMEEDQNRGAEQKMLSALRESLNRELKIKEGSENLLEALNNKKAKQTKDQRLRVETELNSSNQKIKELRNQISELQKQKVPSTPTRSRMDGLFQSSSNLRSPQSVSRSAVESDVEEPTESPTYALAEVLQALEVEGLTPDYYVGHANDLVELFKRHPTLKYDLVWSIFGLRMQVMLLSESREVVAAGYRMIRYAISDINSLQKIRTLNTDYLVVLSLIKERKADVEREQALKFVRAFLEVKGGVQEISRAVVRTIVSVAEHSEDRLRAICIETLAEIMVRNPALVVASGGLRPLSDALGEGTYVASESLTAAFLFLLDAPQRRRYLRSGYELEVLFVAFTDSLYASPGFLKQNSEAIAYAMKSWPGLMTLSMYNFRAIRSLISCLMLPNPGIRETIIDLLYGLFRIKSPFWAKPFFAGRRLTTYGHVASLKVNIQKPPVPTTEDETGEKNFVDHYTALLLAVMISSGMMPGLLQVTRDAGTPELKRKTTLLIGEVLKLASRLLPSSWSSDLQLLPELFRAASNFKNDERFDAAGTVYQISSMYIKVGCALIHTLLQSVEGIKYLADSKLLRQIAECLAQCDPTSGLTAQSPMFSKERLSDTCCSGYFNMLGVLSGDSTGLKLLDRWRMINMMYHIIDLKQRPDLIKLLLSNFDYSQMGHPRVLLSKALTGGSKEIRTHATNVLRRYSGRFRPNGPANQGVGDSKWAIQLLVTQLYDPEVEVCATAVKILEEACNRKNYLEYIVECRPALDHLGEIGAPLLLRFLSTSIGYHYLDGLDYISNEMDDWFLGRNDAYVSVIEASLARAFVESPEESSGRFSIDDDNLEYEGDGDAHVPPHFYKELTRTDEGCKLLRSKGHFEEFANTIREYGMLSDDPEMILKVKGCLWAVGNVGSMELGGPFLEESDVVENIIQIAQSHEIMSLRGTAFFVLGLISRSIHGLEILSEHGWDSNTTTRGLSLGLCIPQDLGKFFSYKPWKHEIVSDIRLTEEHKAEIAAARTDDDPVNQRIIQLVMELGNTVLKNKAMSELMRIKTKKAAGFTQAPLFKKILFLLECHQFRLGIRRFVIDLFDKNVMRQIVLDEESSDEEVYQEIENEGKEEESEEDDSASEGRTARQRSVSNPSGPTTFA
ncbi:hypothetical protein OIDMADRAFT_134612 [Oidiodendron maius Zn]|uniref:REM-1 domain-containing protein n=1 Tax=Oidiodendron maius (strain Zn) TaxID=913774 RepID=A0A0C3CYY1_OIDMZ|nr:hypothetical protein OIDMADRAFT_134612 [Oidiodendron maius Zn]